MNTCTADFVKYDFVWLGTTSTIDMEYVIISMSGGDLLQVIFDGCNQRIEEVKCRAFTSDSWSMCMCNGLGQEWDERVPFLLQKNQW